MNPCQRFPRLTPGEVREIRQLFTRRAGWTTICEKFGITREHVYALCSYGRPAAPSRHLAIKQD
jgi:DNA-binding phage protein